LHDDCLPRSPAFSRSVLMATRCARPAHETVPRLVFLIVPSGMAMFPIDLDRARRTPLASQIYRAIRDAIEAGRLASGARLPSWQDLAAQLGVSRGTVRAAYGRLINE